MGFTIPNYTDAVASGVGDQAEPDSVDFQILGDGTAALVYDSALTDNGLVSAANPANGTVVVSAYKVRVKGKYYSGTGTTLTLDAAGATARFDLVVISTNGTTASIIYRTGTASSTNPVFPTPSSGDVVLAAVYRPGGDSNITTGRIIDKRVIVPSNLSWVENADPDSRGIDGDIWVSAASTANGQSKLWVKNAGAWENLAKYIKPTNLNEASTVVQRDASGNFSAGTITATLSGNATTASVASAVAWSNITGVPSLVYNNGGTYSINISGNAASVSNGVYNNGGTYSINISGSAAYASNAGGLSNGAVVYTNGGGWVISGFTDTPMVYTNGIEIGGGYLGSYGAATGNGATVVRVSNGAIRQTASRRELKTNIEDYTNGLSIVNALRPRTFKWRDHADDPDFEKGLHADFTEHGFIVEEVAEVFPDLVHYVPGIGNNREPSMWKTNDVISILVQAVQELAAKVEALESK